MNDENQHSNQVSETDSARITELLWKFVSPDAKVRHESSLKLCEEQIMMNRDHCETLIGVIRGEGFDTDEFVRRLIVIESVYLWSDNAKQYIRKWGIEDFDRGDRGSDMVALASPNPAERSRATDAYLRALAQGLGWKPPLSQSSAHMLCTNRLMNRLLPEIANATDLVARRLASRPESHGVLLDALRESASYDQDILTLLLNQIKGHNGYPFGDLAYNGETITETVGRMISNHSAALETVMERWRQANTKDRDSLFRCLARADGKLGRYGDELLEAAFARYQESGNGLEIIAGIGPNNEGVFEFVASQISKGEPEWDFIGNKNVTKTKREVFETHPEYFDEHGNPDHEKIAKDRNGPYYYAIDNAQIRRGEAIDAMRMFKAFPDQAIDSLIEAWEVFEEYDPDQTCQSERQSRICDSLCCFGPDAIRALPLLRHELEHREKLPAEERNIDSICNVLSAIGPAAADVLPLLEDEARAREDDPDDDDYYDFINMWPLARAICVLRGHDPADYER